LSRRTAPKRAGTLHNGSNRFPNRLPSSWRGKFPTAFPTDSRAPGRFPNRLPSCSRPRLRTRHTPVELLRLQNAPARTLTAPKLAKCPRSGARPVCKHFRSSSKPQNRQCEGTPESTASGGRTVGGLRFGDLKGFASPACLLHHLVSEEFAGRPRQHAKASRLQSLSRESRAGRFKPSGCFHSCAQFRPPGWIGTEKAYSQPLCPDFILPTFQPRGSQLGRLRIS